MSLNPAEMYHFHTGGKKDALPFADQEYFDRLEGLREIMELHDLDAVVLTSMHGVAYYCGFLQGGHGRPCACVVTKTDCVTISAGIDGGQPWRRSIADNIIYTDRARDNMWQAVASVTGTGRAVGCEADHLTMEQAEKFGMALRPKRGMDIAPAAMHQRMVKSPAEIALIRHGAQVADLGGHAIREAIVLGATEREISNAGRDAMEREIARRFPDAEYRDTGALFQSGINTDGAQTPVTSRKLKHGDILSLNCVPMISGYGTPLRRTLFLGAVDEASLRVWQANIDSHAFGVKLLRPGASCAEIAGKINTFLAERALLDHRTEPHGHGVGILSHASGRDTALELREDNDTVLEPGMVIAMEATLTIPAGMPGAGGYREQDIVIVTEDAPEDIAHYPQGLAFNVIG